jgi:hypothetical protein
MRKSVGRAPTAGEKKRKKPCRMSSNIGAEQENHAVGRGLTESRKGLNQTASLENRILTAANVNKNCAEPIRYKQSHAFSDTHIIS